MTPPDPEWSNLVGAFAHEIRTPLTAATMVMQLAGPGPDGTIELDAELAGMLSEALESIRLLTDQLQETSRLVRGLVPLNLQPVSMREIALAVAVAATVSIDQAGVPATIGTWDAGRLVPALAALAAAADRVGGGSGRVALRGTDGDPASFELVSGTGGDDREPDRSVTGAATLGFEYFAARVVIQAMGGDVEWSRGQGGSTVRVTLPRGSA